MSTPLLTLVDLHKAYEVNNTAVSALRGIHLSVARGAIVGIIGKSGAGKSTLIRSINLLERPTKGSVIFDGQDLKTLTNENLRKVRQQMGMIFQHFNLLSSRTVFQNAALPLELQGLKKSEIEKRVMPLLELVGLSDRLDYFPEQLSGGQKQRVAIARALALRPQLLLCDEATSALDPESTRAILNLLKQINQEMGLTIVLITHAMDVIKQICDQVGVIDEGQLVEWGEVVEVFANPQHPVTQRLIGQVVQWELPENLQSQVRSQQTAGLHLLVRLTFVNNSAKTPLISHIHERFGVTVNILQADLEYIHGNSLGFMLCQLIGASQDIDKALHYLTEHSVKSEAMGYV